jgi:hypothetical protein
VEASVAEGANKNHVNSHRRGLHRGLSRASLKSLGSRRCTCGKPQPGSCGGLATAPPGGLQPAARRSSPTAPATARCAAATLQTSPAAHSKTCAVDCRLRQLRGRRWGRHLRLFRIMGDQTWAPCVGGFRQDPPSDGYALWGAQMRRLKMGREKREVLEGLALPEPLRITP